MVPAFAQTNAGAVDLGQPPSGAIPILIDDHHVYAKPDELRRGRLLAALVRNGHVMIPLQAMLELLGAAVSYDAGTRTTTVRRSNTVIRLTAGVPSVVIDGDTKPLDVAPEFEDGVLLVPVRVIAEVLGAYVQYERPLRAVVIRYLPATAVIPAPPLALHESPPGPVVTATATPGPRATVGPGPPIPVDRPPLEAYVAVDIVVSPKVQNQYDPGTVGPVGQTFDVRAADEFALFDVPFAVDAEFARFAFPHAAGNVENLGKTGVAFVPAFDGRDSIFETHLTTQINPEKFSLGFGYAVLGTSYGSPRMYGPGAGIEKFPVLSDHLSYDGSVFFYPNIHGVCACPGGTIDVNYSLLTYRAGLTYGINPLFLDAGYLGDRQSPKGGAPIGIDRDGPYVGLGLHF